jgi:hypothetical protein
MSFELPYQDDVMTYEQIYSMTLYRTTENDAGSCCHQRGDSSTSEKLTLTNAVIEINNKKLTVLFFSYV